MLENNTQIASIESRVATLETDLSNITTKVYTNVVSITNLTEKIKGIENRPTAPSFGTSANFTSLVNRVNELETTGSAVNEKSSTWYD